MSIVLTVLRGLFVLLMAGIGWHYVNSNTQIFGSFTWLANAIAIAMGVIVLSVDILAPRRKLTIFAGSFLGLIVGVSISYALSFVVQLLVDLLYTGSNDVIATRAALSQFINLMVSTITCYLSISFILQTKDDFRFIIPYVEFRKQTKGSRPILLDTSAIIDGRIAAIIQIGLFESQFIIPRFVLQELQTIADNGDRLKRNRGRRGLDVVAKLQQVSKVEIVIYDSSGRDASTDSVDQRLMQLAKELEARLLTTDFNLQKVAQLAGIDVININELAGTMKPEALPGERMTVRIIKPGEGANQGVGYMDDGTMVVIEQARSMMNEEVEFSVTNTVQTNAGKMVFGRMIDTLQGKKRPSDHPQIAE